MGWCQTCHARPAVHGVTASICRNALLIMPQPLPLITKIVSGGLWSGFLRIAGRGMGLIRTLILARLLFPEDFGQIGM